MLTSPLMLPSSRRGTIPTTTDTAVGTGCLWCTVVLALPRLSGRRPDVTATVRLQATEVPSPLVSSMRPIAVLLRLLLFLEGTFYSICFLLTVLGLWLRQMLHSAGCEVVR